MMADVQARRVEEAAVLADLDGGHRNHRKRFNGFLSSMDYGLKPYPVRVDVRDLLLSSITSVEVPMLLPHEMLGGVWRRGWDVVSKVLLGSVPEGIRCVKSGCGPHISK